MIIIVGLGNPGSKFDHTRHNTGFAVVDFFAAKNNFPEFKESQKYHSFISENNNIILAKPETFMNESGQAVRELIKNQNEPLLVVVHDEIDLPLGKIKFSKDSGAGGHKGVDSIIQHIGNNNFVRLKIGIATGGHKAQEVVLEKFSEEEQIVLEQAIETSCQALKKLIDEGLEKTMNEYNR